MIRPAPKVEAPQRSGEVCAISPASVAETGKTFAITEIALVGDSILDASEQARITRPFLAVPLGAKRLDLLLRCLTETYLERGYVTTRAYLGPQNVASGRLTVTVLPGKVERIEVDRHPGRALPLEPGAVLRLADIEQAVDQLNRLRSQHAEAKILPGQSPGVSALSIATHADKPWRVLFGADNYGQSATGEQRQRASIEYDNLLGLWDFWSLTEIASADSRTELLSFSVPVGYATLNYSYARSFSRVDLLAGIVSTTRSAGHNLSLDYVVARDKQWRHALDFGLSTHNYERSINALALAPQQQLSGRVSESSLYRGSRGAVSFELGYGFGIPHFGADGDVEGLPASAPHNEFEKWDGSLSLAWSPVADWSWRTQLSAQYSHTGLPGVEQLFLGGAASVRGFKEGIVSGDRGFLMRNELQWNRAISDAQLSLGSRLDPFVFFDLAEARQISDRNDSRLASVGVGLRATWKDVSVDLAWASPQTAPAGVERDDRIHFSLSYLF